MARGPKAWKYSPAPTPEFLHKQRLERESNEPPKVDIDPVPWQVNAELMRRIDETFNQGE